MSDSNNQNPFNTPPPGLLGHIARFIYEAAPRPVPEIALAGAIGLMSGIVGRSYNVSGTGLNQYVLLLAPTGCGKEGMASGATALMKVIRSSVPASTDFIGPACIASQQALIKYLANTSSSFVSVIGEFGLTLKQMADPKAPAHLVGLRQIMLDLFAKSGRNDELRPLIYSDREKNTATIQSPAFSLLGESTPERFYETLNENMISEGLLPRFTVIEYCGERPPLNKNRRCEPPQDSIHELSALCSHSLMLNSRPTVIDVCISPEAMTTLEAFDAECDANINGANTEVTRHLWNRAHLKALKLAALVAVGCDPYQPTILPEYASWAISLECASVRTLLARFANGDVGDSNGEDARIKKVIEAFCVYVTTPWVEMPSSYELKRNLHDSKIVTYTYLHRRLCNSSKHFKKDGYTEPGEILKRTLRTLIDRGDIQEVGRTTLVSEYGFTGTAYMLSVAGIQLTAEYLRARGK